MSGVVDIFRILDTVYGSMQQMLMGLKLNTSKGLILSVGQKDSLMSSESCLNITLCADDHNTGRAI